MIKFPDILNLENANDLRKTCQNFIKIMLLVWKIYAKVRNLQIYSAFSANSILWISSCQFYMEKLRYFRIVVFIFFFLLSFLDPERAKGHQQRVVFIHEVNQSN